MSPDVFMQLLLVGRFLIVNPTCLCMGTAYVMMAQTSASVWRGTCPILEQRGGTTPFLLFWRLLDRYMETF